MSRYETEGRTWTHAARRPCHHGSGRWGRCSQKPRNAWRGVPGRCENQEDPPGALGGSEALQHPDSRPSELGMDPFLLQAAQHGGHWSQQPQVTDIASPVCQELPGCQAHSEHFTRRADSMLMSSKWHVQGRQGLRAPWKVTWEAPGPLSWHTPCRRTQLPHFLQWHLRRRANSAWMEPSVLDGGLRLPGVPKAAPTAPDPCLCIRGRSTALGPGESCVAIRLPGVLCERNSPPLPEPLPGGRPHSPRWPASP